MKLSAAFLLFLLLASMFPAFGQEIIRSPAPAEKSLTEAAPKITREVFDAEKTPALAAVGRINFIGQSWCTGVLVAPDIVVTAGHCILKANIKFNTSKDFDPFWTTVNFKPNGRDRIEGVSVRRVLAAKMNPDYAILQLNVKIPESKIKPLAVSKSTLIELRGDESHLGCAGFNGDKELGGGGFLMTISRNVKIIPESSSNRRIDASCFSTYGGSGGLFFREAKANEFEFLGVIWGLTDEKIDEKGELVKTLDVVTSITPASLFYDELTKFTSKK